MNYVSSNASDNLLMREKLKEIIKVVLEHKSEIDAELDASIHFRVLGIKKGDPSKENLKKWFILTFGSGWRAGPLPSLKTARDAMRSFDMWYDHVMTEILPGGRWGQEAMDDMYKSLVKIINGVGWKIAGVYLRDIIYHFEIWPQFKEYLYVPVDRHIRNILINKLGAFAEIEVPKAGESYSTKKNKKFQKILGEIHMPRVEFDYFWYIGAKFCSYHLCDFCWIRDFCMDKKSIL